MPTNIYESSQIIKRQAEKTIANSFLSRLYPPNGPNGNPIRQPLQGSAPLLGILDNSILNSVKTGNMTKYTRYPNYMNINIGCPCPKANIYPLPNELPGPITNINFTIGSIIVSWNPPTYGSGPFRYKITPYLNNIALTTVYTDNTSYRFEDLEEWKAYTFTVCAINSLGEGPNTSSNSYFIAPPKLLSDIMSGSTVPIDPEEPLKYIINYGLDTILKYASTNNLGPTRGSRFIYIWVFSIATAWNWVRSDNKIIGIHDTWNWDSKSNTLLSDNDTLIWLSFVIDYITPILTGNTTYKSIYNYSNDVINRIKQLAEWDIWSTMWNNWYNYRNNDGYIAASTIQPESSNNWNNTIIVDGVTINNISNYPAPNEWTRLTVLGKKQNYLTHQWHTVISSCLTEEEESEIQSSITPSIGQDRDNEIDTVKDITSNLTDEQKIIAEFWAGGPGTISPPLMFIWFWKEYIKCTEISCPNMIYSLLDLSIHLFEGGRVTWRLKAAHMEARPIQEIRRRYTGELIKSWNGLIDGSQWIPYQELNFISPPFADFPSGHSHFSKAFSLTMNKWFGENIGKVGVFYDMQPLISPLFKGSESGTFGSFVISKGASLIEPGIVPTNQIVLSFDKWDDMANQAGISRLYGGIHAITAHISSQNVAIQLDNYINSKWNITI